MPRIFLESPKVQRFYEESIAEGNLFMSAFAYAVHRFLCFTKKQPMNNFKNKKPGERIAMPNLGLLK